MFHSFASLLTCGFSLCCNLCFYMVLLTNSSPLGLSLQVPIIIQLIGSLRVLAWFKVHSIFGPVSSGQWEDDGNHLVLRTVPPRPFGERGVAGEAMTGMFTTSRKFKFRVGSQIIC